MIALDNDNYGRTVTIQTANGQDTYSVMTSDGILVFTIAFDSGWPLERVYDSINAMAPSS